ncbi:type ii secretion system (t2ss), protein e, n-terminal domain, partial [Plakobranchus ocellatus]
VHEFEWHGTDPRNKARMVPGLNKFIRLPTIPDNFYYNVREVRTTDDTMLTVKVMLFYRMEDVLKMMARPDVWLGLGLGLLHTPAHPFSSTTQLHSGTMPDTPYTYTTHDPIADLINALCADVISFVGPLTYQQFVEKTSLLSSLETYPQLVHRAESIGFTVEKVVFRGYHASDQLQEMQNNAIETRTKLRLMREIEDQEQKLAALKLDRQQQRSSIQQEMALKRQAHKQKLEELKQQHKLEMDEMVLAQQLELESQEYQARLESQKAEDSHKLVHLANLAKLNVDLTKVVNLQYQVPPREEIRVIFPSPK